MAEEIRFESVEFRGTAGDLDDVGGRVAGMLSELWASAAAYEGRIGKGKFGQTFRGGNGYDAGKKNLKAAAESKPELLQSYSEGLREAANRLDAMEFDNEQGFRT
ncbi:hypothetical protein OHB12_01150 [Nocardia sp. NBC_01730]|uniref:hypothetical protein n=1 Tax=Nocardia sp. NBC_01730 TaxID=2975998 RepID=UPI002E10B920|nr:hypothetical protein OHB12_01150 [Nocardia sp. NBC_01730]